MLAFLHEHDICHLDWESNMQMNVIIPRKYRRSPELKGTHGPHRRYALMDFGEAFFRDEEGKYLGGKHVIDLEWARQEDVRQLGEFFRRKITEVWPPWNINREISPILIGYYAVVSEFSQLTRQYDIRRQTLAAKCV
jgi:hypothetical protein